MYIVQLYMYDCIYDTTYVICMYFKFNIASLQINLSNTIETVCFKIFLEMEMTSVVS